MLSIAHIRLLPLLLYLSLAFSAKAADYLGKPEQMYDHSGKLIWDAEYDSYGNVRRLKGSSLKERPFRWPGQYADEETGLCYNRFRYYDPRSGVYLSQDPIGLAGNNLSFYAYVWEPNRLFDPYGLFCIKFNPFKKFDYARGGKMSVLKHILKRHRASTQYDDVSKFLTDSSRKIQRLVRQGVKEGVVDLSDNSIVMRFSRDIGKNVDGNMSRTLKIFFDDKGWVRTAFPI